MVYCIVKCFKKREKNVHGDIENDIDDYYRAVENERDDGFFYQKDDETVKENGLE